MLIGARQTDCIVEGRQAVGCRCWRCFGPMLRVQKLFVPLSCAALAPGLCLALAQNDKAGNPYKVRLKDGTVAEIMSVGHGDAEKLPIWRPNGQLISNPNRDGRMRLLNSPVPGQRLVVVEYSLKYNDHNVSGRVALQGLQAKARLNGNIVSTSGGFMMSPNLLKAEQGFQVPSDLKQADMEVGYGTDPYKVQQVYEDGVGDFKFDIVKDPVNSGAPKSSADRNSKRAAPEQRMIEFNFDVPRRLLDKQWGIRVFDRLGNSVSTMVYGKLPVNYMPGAPERWKGAVVYPSQIGRVELVARDYHWIKIRNIRLVPSTVASR